MWLIKKLNCFLSSCYKLSHSKPLLAWFSNYSQTSIRNYFGINGLSILVVIRSSKEKQWLQIRLSGGQGRLTWSITDRLEQWGSGKEPRSRFYLFISSSLSHRILRGVSKDKSDRKIKLSNSCSEVGRGQGEWEAGKDQTEKKTGISALARDPASGTNKMLNGHMIN